MRNKKTKSIISLVLSALILFSMAAPALAAQKISNPDIRGGIDGIDPNPDVGLHNSYAWCSEVFQQADSDYIWIGTNRDLGASVFSSTTNELFPLSILDIPDRSDDTAAKIYRQRVSDAGAQWEQVYEHPAITGYRRMIIFKEDLYVLAGSTNRAVANYTFILRFRKDFKIGDTPEIVFWQPLPIDSNNLLRAATILDDKLYIGTLDSRIFVTDGEGIENLVPGTGANMPGWSLVGSLNEHGGPPAAGIWDIIGFNGSIYAFLTGAPIQASRGFGVMKVTPNGSGYSYSQIVGDDSAPYPYGFGIFKNVGASPFLSTSFGKDYVYVSTFNYGPLFLVAAGSGYAELGYSYLWCPAQIYRFDENDNWEVVVGDQIGELVAVDQGGTPLPYIGNQRAGFYLQDNELNISPNQYIWWLMEHEGKLYATTWDVGIFAQYYWMTTLLSIDIITEGAVTLLLSYLGEIIELSEPIIEYIREMDIQGLREELMAYLQEIDEAAVEVSEDELMDMLREIIGNCIGIIKKYMPEESEALTQLINTLMALARDLGALELDLREVVTSIMAYFANTYVYTTDTSNPPGFDLYVSEDGMNFYPVTVNGFGDPANYGGRVMVSSDHGLYVTTANPFHGGQAWRVSPVELAVYPNGPSEVFLSEGDTAQMTVLITDAEAAVGSLQMNYNSDLVSAVMVPRNDSAWVTDIKWDNQLLTNPETNRRYYSVTETETQYLYKMYDIIITPLESGQEDLTIYFELDGISASKKISLTIDLEYESEQVDKSQLNAAIVRASILSQDSYTPATWASFVMMFATAQSTFDNVSANQNQVDNATANLITAIEGLEPRPDKTALNAKLMETSALVESDYTAESWASYLTARNVAMLTSAGVNVTQLQVNNALAYFIEAIEALVPVSGPVVNKTALQALINAAESYNQTDYTAASWAAFSEALTIAKAVNDNSAASQQDVNDALANLQSGMGNLVVVTTVNKSALLALLNTSNSYSQADYTAASWATFASMRNNAQETYQKTDATQEQVDKAFADLSAAINALVPVPVTPGVVVNTLEQLKAALADKTVSVVTLGADITAPRTPDPKIVIDHSVEINGQNHVLDMIGNYIYLESNGTLKVSNLTMKTTDRYGFFSAYSASPAKAGTWDIVFANVTFEGSALAGQRTSSTAYGTINSVTFQGLNAITTTGTNALNAVVYARNVFIDGNFEMNGSNNSTFFKSVDSSGSGTGVSASGCFEVAPGANVNFARKLSSATSNTYTSNLIEGYESFIFGSNSSFSAIAGTNLSGSNPGNAQTAIIYSGAAKEFTLKSGAQVALVSDHSATSAAAHGSTALSLRKPAGGNLDITVEALATLSIEAYGTNARTRSLAPVIISSKPGTSSGTSKVLVQGTVNVYSKNGNGWYYQYIDYATNGSDSIIVDGGTFNIDSDGPGGRSNGEYAALEHYGPVDFNLEVINSGKMNIKTNGWRAMSLAGAVLAAAPEKTITVSGAGSELFLDAGQIAISAEGKTVFTLNVLAGGYVSTRNTQDANVYTTGQATFNVDGIGSSLKMLRTGVTDVPGSTDKTSLYGVIYHDAPRVGPLTINITNGGYMAVYNSFGNRAAITAQSNYITNHSINVTGPGSDLCIFNDNPGTSSDATLYPLGAIAFSANCSGNVNVSNGGKLYADSNSPDSPTIALGSYGTSNYTGALTANSPGVVDIRNNANTTNTRAIALRGRNYTQNTSNDTAATLNVNNASIAVWAVGGNGQEWTQSAAIESWNNVSFTAANSAISNIAAGAQGGATQFNLAKYGRIYID